jgi:hypothetical protein
MAMRGGELIASRMDALKRGLRTLEYGWKETFLARLGCAARRIIYIPIFSI